MGTPGGLELPLLVKEAAESGRVGVGGVETKKVVGRQGLAGFREDVGVAEDGVGSARTEGKCSVMRSTAG